MERVFQLPPTTYIGGPERSLPLKEIIHRLEVSVAVLSVLNDNYTYSTHPVPNKEKQNDEYEHRFY